LLYVSSPPLWPPSPRPRPRRRDRRTITSQIKYQHY
jgi:hypothetical protein